MSQTFKKPREKSELYTKSDEIDSEQFDESEQEYDVNDEIETNNENFYDLEDDDYAKEMDQSPALRNEKSKYNLYANIVVVLMGFLSFVAFMAILTYFMIASIDWSIE